MSPLLTPEVIDAVYKAMSEIDGDFTAEFVRASIRASTVLFSEDSAPLVAEAISIGDHMTFAQADEISEHADQTTKDSIEDFRLDIARARREINFTLKGRVEYSIDFTA